jgi:DNA-binding beta-propeller fold protein YncE
MYYKLAKPQNPALIFLGMTILFLSCAPEKPQPEISPRDILNLQVIDVIGPNIGGGRALAQPRDIAVNMNKDIFIADYGNDRIVKLDRDYNFIKEVGGFGNSSYALNGPVSLSLDNVSNLYVVDSGNKRILRFDRNLNFISEQTGYTKSTRVNFINPACIYVTARGDVFIGDEGLSSCFKLDQFFNYVYEFADRGSVQPVGYPYDIDFSRNNRIYVADYYYSQVMIFDDFGLYLDSFGQNVLKKPSAVEISPRTGIWVADSENGMIYCFDFKGKEIFRWAGETGYRLLKPSALFIENDDTLYIVDSQSSRIFVTQPVLRD